eukprot:CAMPEP_0194586274 /NCGR_PEP_ID=MMETSP0292-20121207/18324_1 /TAXON_ID=39354 /ORGANISM="Heterosigma akashiwo, Strain CCMP2393" /LENGTH=40 /DNA_ID= /DNA_START= /DNA_END= /DNA_ORIENTATION=
MIEKDVLLSFCCVSMGGRCLLPLCTGEEFQIIERAEVLTP